MPQIYWCIGSLTFEALLFRTKPTVNLRLRSGRHAVQRLGIFWWCAAITIWCTEHSWICIQQQTHQATWRLARRKQLSWFQLLSWCQMWQTITPTESSCESNLSKRLNGYSLSSRSTIFWLVCLWVKCWRWLCGHSCLGKPMRPGWVSVSLRWFRWQTWWSRQQFALSRICLTWCNFLSSAHLCKTIWICSIWLKAGVFVSWF